MYFIHLIRIYYFTNLTYFPIFLYFVDFLKVAAASPLAAAAAAAAAQLATDRAMLFTLFFKNSHWFFNLVDKKWQTKCYF